jgi:hypothetical protein
MPRMPDDARTGDGDFSDPDVFIARGVVSRKSLHLSA